jgi:molybdopterin synthase catalytic subunit
MNYLKLTSDKLDVGALNEQVADESCGAISLFVGTTRDYFEDKTVRGWTKFWLSMPVLTFCILQVLCLEYEAYEAMALKSMNSICEEIRQRWKDVKHIGMHHRLGKFFKVPLMSPEAETELPKLLPGAKVENVSTFRPN